MFCFEICTPFWPKKYLPPWTRYQNRQGHQVYCCVSTVWSVAIRLTWLVVNPEKWSWFRGPDQKCRDKKQENLQEERHHGAQSRRQNYTQKLYITRDNRLGWDVADSWDLGFGSGGQHFTFISSLLSAAGHMCGKFPACRSIFQDSSHL